VPGGHVGLRMEENGTKNLKLLKKTNRTTFSDC